MASTSISVSKAIPTIFLIREQATAVALEDGDVALYLVGATEPKIFKNEPLRIWALEISGDLLFCGRSDGSITIWSIETGEKLRVLEGHTSSVRCLTVFRTNSLLSASRDGTLRVWDINTGTLRHVLSGHTDTIRCIFVNENKVVSGSQDSTSRLWDLDTGACLATFAGHKGSIFSVTFDGNTVLTGGLDTKIRVWDAKSGEMSDLLHEHGSLVSHMVPLGENLYTASADGQIIVWKREPLELINEIFAHEHGITGLDLTSSKDGVYLISGGMDGMVKICKIEPDNYPESVGELADAVYTVGFQGPNAVAVVRRNGETLLETTPFGERGLN